MDKNKLDYIIRVVLQQWTVGVLGNCDKIQPQNIQKPSGLMYLILSRWYTAFFSFILMCYWLSLVLLEVSQLCLIHCVSRFRGNKKVHILTSNGICNKHCSLISPILCLTKTHRIQSQWSSGHLIRHFFRASFEVLISDSLWCRLNWTLKLDRR